MEKHFDIQFEDNQSVPKYRQIIDAIQQKIKSGDLKKGDKIPSLNMFCKEYGLSQDTVLMAYNELKAKGIIIFTGRQRLFCSAREHRLQAQGLAGFRQV
jgi:DNA-binding transcriptional regulator YhcF (GntR family)